MAEKVAKELKEVVLAQQVLERAALELARKELPKLVALSDSLRDYERRPKPAALVR